MNFVLQPWQLLFAILSGWINRRQQDITAFQNAQINTLLQQFGRKRILLTDDQRRVLAVKAKAFGRKALLELTTIVTPIRSSAGIANSWRRSGITARNGRQLAGQESVRSLST
jgi:hypothetical protein